MEKSQSAQYIVSQRFGFGPRVGDAKLAPSLNDQLKSQPYVTKAITSLPTTDELLAHMGDLNRRRKESMTEEEKKAVYQDEQCIFSRKLSSFGDGS